MAKIKHIAIATQDPEATARFYTDVFGMKQIGRIDSPDARGYFLSDGDINLAILKFKSDAVAGAERGKDWSGIHHIGFQVESLEAIAERLAQVGSQRRDDINNALGLGRAVSARQCRGEVHRARRRHGGRLRNRLGRHPDFQPALERRRGPRRPPQTLKSPRAGARPREIYAALLAALSATSSSTRGEYPGAPRRRPGPSCGGCPRWASR